MKKLAGTLILAVGVILLGLNYFSFSGANFQKDGPSFFNTELLKENKVSEENVDVATINLPSIFSVIIGLLK